MRLLETSEGHLVQQSSSVSYTYGKLHRTVFRQMSKIFKKRDFTISLGSPYQNSMTCAVKKLYLYWYWAPLKRAWPFPCYTLSSAIWLRSTLIFLQVEQATFGLSLVCRSCNGELRTERGTLGVVSAVLSKEKGLLPSTCWLCFP